MTVQDTTPFDSYEYMVPSVFPFNFKIQKDEDLTVTHIDGGSNAETLLTLGIDYTVTINDDTDGGSAEVSYVGTVGTLNLARSILANQLVDWVNNTPFDMEILENAVDKLTMMVQQLSWHISTELGIPLTEVGDLLAYNGLSLDRLPVGVLDQVLTADPTSPLGLAWKAASGDGGLIPTTTKGDLSGYSTLPTRVPVAGDGLVLSGDSSSPTGVSYQKLTDLPWDPDNPGTGPGTGPASPLTTKGDILTRDSAEEVRLPVGSDDFVLVPEAANPNGIIYKKLKDIPLDPDDPAAGYPGSGLPLGIAQPDEPPLAANQLIAYSDTSGTQAANPAAETNFPGVATTIGDMRIYTDATGTVHFESIGVGPASIVVHGAGGSITLESGATENTITATGLPLALVSDTPYPSPPLPSFEHAMQMDGLFFPPGSKAVSGLNLQGSDSGSAWLVFDGNSAANPGKAFGHSVVGP